MSRTGTCLRRPVASAAATALLAAAALMLHAAVASAQEPDRGGLWTAAVELGELPMHGSFKVGLSVGYQMNEYAWLGVAWQAADAIQRDGTSFNASSLRLDGLTTSREDVGPRAYLQARLRPHRLSPYLSVGAVFNGRDTEAMVFDPRPRSAGGHAAEGGLRVRVSRPAAIRPALGVGYEWTSGGGVTAFVEWAGWWLADAPDPEISIQGDGVTGGFSREVDARLRDHFVSSLFNTYHIFQLGVGISR